MAGSSSGSYSWEQPWEAPPRWMDSDSDEEDAMNVELQGEEAGQELVEFLLSLYFAGKMSAKTVCVMCWWSSRAGALGPAKDL
eukprot:10038727-Alexandrium_andersonii.AAC.1